MTDYSKKTNAELVEVLKTRSLPHTGKKADLVARLQQDDDKSSAPASAAKPIDNAEDVIDWDDDEPAEAETVTVAATSEGANPIADKTVAEPVAAPVPTAAESEAAPATTAETAPVEAEKKPAVDYTRGLPATELEEELRKRKARAEKFGTVEDSATALKEAEKAVLRAKRFATGGTSETTDATKINVGVKGLDEALPSEITRNNNGKRVRNDRSGPGGKRQNLGRRQQRGNGQAQNQNQGRQGNGSGGQRSNGPSRNQNQNRTGGAGNKAQGGVVKSSWNDKDSSAMEARKKRFATAT